MPKKPAERDVENKFVKYAQSKGCQALKLRIHGQNGFPDRTIITPKGIYFVEFKTDIGKLRPMQKIWKSKLQKLNFICYITTTLEDAKNQLDGFLKREIHPP